MDVCYLSVLLRIDERSRWLRLVYTILLVVVAVEVQRPFPDGESRRYPNLEAGRAVSETRDVYVKHTCRCRMEGNPVR